MQAKVIKFLPNILTLLRFPLGSIFGFLLFLDFSKIRCIPIWAFAICFLLILITDILDGKLARSLQAVSDIGAKLDVLADSFYIFLSLTILNLYQIIPVWFTVLVIFKLVDFLVSSRVFAMRSPFIFDLPGRAAAAEFFIVPFFSTVCQITILHIILIVFIPIVVLSSLMRWCVPLWRCFKNLNS